MSRCPSCNAELRSPEAACSKCDTPEAATTIDAASDARPSTLGKYALLNVLGRGGMGVVYLALDQTLNRHVAVKLMRGDAAPDEQDRIRFMREARAAAKLQHPSIVAVHEIAEAEGRPYIVMDYVRGEPLRALIDRMGLIPPRAALKIALQIAEALAYAHAHGIIHRDVKPGNILLTTERAGEPEEERRHESKLQFESATSSAFRALLADFGLAREVESDSRLTLTGEVMGTPAYMSPEQADGDIHRVGPTSDVFSLGAVLYEMLTGRLPFPGDSPWTIIRKILSEEPAPPRSIVAALHADVQTIALKAMAKEQSRRYAGAADFAADIRHTLKGEPISARPATPAYRLRMKIVRNKLASGAIAAAVLLIFFYLYMAYAPGSLAISGNIDGATLWIDGRPQSAADVTIWPPRKVRLRVTKEGYDDIETDVVVRSRTREEVPVRLLSGSGFVAVQSGPPGAEVHWDGALLGVTPLAPVRVRTGRHAIELRLADHEPVTDAPFIKPDETTTLKRPLRHEQGFLTLTSEPRELSVELRPAQGDPVLTAAPASRLPIDTGRYRGVARAHNRFAREFDLAIGPGAAESRHLTLNSMLLWRYTGGEVLLRMRVGDVNGDPYPDIVAAWTHPGRLAAIDGSSGRLLWHTAFAGADEEEQVFSLDLADLDGDLSPEVILAPRYGAVRIHDGRTGALKLTFDVGSVETAHVAPDLDGNGLPDLFVGLWTGGLLALEGSSGRRLWTVPTSGRINNPQPARLNEDDVPDVLLGTRDGAVMGIDGRTGRTLWDRRGGGEPGPVPWDVNGDGIDDAVQCSYDRHVYAFSGRDGSVLWKSDRPLYEEFSARPMGVIGDVDGDGQAELVQGTGNGGPLVIVDARTGRVEASFEEIVTGWTAASLCDVNADGVPDVLIPSGSSLVALDVARGRIIWTYYADSPVTKALPADFNGDGRQDIAVTARSGDVLVLSARDPPILWKQTGNRWNTFTVHPIGQALFLTGFDVRMLRPHDGSLIAMHSTSTSLPVSSIAGLEAAAVGMFGLMLLELPRMNERWTARGPMTLSPPGFLDANGDGIQDVCWGDAFARSPLRVSDGRDGRTIWQKPLQRTTCSAMALVNGALYVSSARGVHGLDPRTGDEVRFFATGGSAGSVLPVGEELLVGTSKGILYRLRPSDRSVVWESRAGSGVTMPGAASAGTLVVVATNDGDVLGIDAPSGADRWRKPLGEPMLSGVALHDVDGDGTADAAVATSSGHVYVLSGEDGRVLWDWKLPAQVGDVVPVWLDLDGDGRAELLLPVRDDYVYALRVEPSASAALFWPDAGIRTSEEARLETARERVRHDVEVWRREQRWERILESATADASSHVFYHAALAAHRLGEREKLLALARQAWQRGCRRLDLQLLRCAALPDAQGERELARALQEASLDQIAENFPAAETAALWRRAARRVEGDAERRLWVHAPVGPWEKIEEAFEQARQGGADMGRLLLARGRAAVAAERYDQARADLTESRLEPATRELDRLEAEARQTCERARESWGRGEHGAAVALLEKTVRIDPRKPVYWNDLAWYRATGPEPDGARALECSRRSIELLGRQRPEDLPTRALYLDTLAAAHFAAGQLDEAVRVQQEAMALPVTPSRLQEFRDRLGKYQRAAEGRPRE